jgi:hypothetical protein
MLAAATGPRIAMSHPVTFEIDVPDTREDLHLPAGVDERRQSLLDRTGSEAPMRRTPTLDAVPPRRR